MFHYEAALNVVICIVKQKPSGQCHVKDP